MANKTTTLPPSKDGRYHSLALKEFFDVKTGGSVMEHRREDAKPISGGKSPSGEAAADLCVYVRIRPLLPSEASEDTLVMATTSLQAPAVAYKSIGGYNGVFGPEIDNRQVYQQVRERIMLVKQGCTTNLFTYGYIGSGKTHTLLGYGEEKGLFELAAAELFETLDEGVFLSASVCELYQDKCFDLLDPNKTECMLREDASGQLRILGPAKTFDLKEVVDNLELSNEEYATVVMQRQGLVQCSIRSTSDLDELVQAYCAARSVGISTEHNRSSRSHVVMELRLVTETIRNAEETLASAESKLPALLKALDNTAASFMNELVEKASLDSTNQTFELKEYADGNEWSNRLEMLRKRQAPVFETALRTLKDVEHAKEELALVRKNGVDGKLVVVDLAGADYDHRGGKAQSESIAINKSLLCLKECLQATAEKRPARFRGSKLTRVLQQALSKRSVSIMLLNVCPVARLERRTVNALGYGQLFTNKQKLGHNKAASSSRRSKPWLKDRHASKKENMNPNGKGSGGGGATFEVVAKKPPPGNKQENTLDNEKSGGE